MPRSRVSLFGLNRSMSADRARGVRAGRARAWMVAAGVGWVAGLAGVAGAQGVAGVGGVGGVGARQGEGVWATLLDMGLESRPGRVVALEGGGVGGVVVVYLDERGRRREARSGEMLAVMPLLVRSESERSEDGRSVIVRTIEEDARGGERKGGAATGYLGLTDRQRYTGDLMTPASGAAEDRLAWRHEVFGALSFAFDRVRGFRRSGAEEAGAWGAWGGWGGLMEGTPNRDTLRLSNGDVLRGFLEGLGDPVRFEVDGERTEVEFGLVRGAELANAPTPARRMRVWLGDGSVVEAESVSLEASGRLLVTLPEGQRGSFEWGSVRAVLFDAERLMPLASARARSQRATGDRRYAAPIERVTGVEEGADGGGGTNEAPALDAWDLALPGPMAVEFELPAGAARLAMTMALAGSGVEPAVGEGWGDCEVSIWLDGRAALRTRLWSESREAAVALELGGATALRIVVEAGRYGPIGDRVMLRRPLVLVGE